MRSSVEGASSDYDLAVIGAGPAGQAACLSINGALRIAVIDEQARPGGQILRQPPRAFSVADWMKGGAYRGLKARLAAFEALTNVDFMGGRSVLGLCEAGGVWTLTLSGASGVEEVSARRVLIAGGCYDLAAPIPGWTLPGVMSAGGTQAFIKSQQLVPGKRLAFAGSHPLQLLVAEQALDAGGDVAVVAFVQPFSTLAWRAITRPWAALTHWPVLVSALGSAWRLLRAGVPLRFGRAALSVEGQGRVSALHLGGAERFDCDAAALCFGFMPQADLPRAAGLQVTPARPGGWKSSHDEWMRASRRGVYVAGETTGVKGAAAASAEGALAGLAVALDEGLIDQGEARRRARPWRKARRAAMRFAALLEAIADPGPFSARLPDADTIVCRCEDVALGDLQAALAQCAEVGSVKLATRCGMGACQGRNCEHSLLSLAGQPQSDRSGFTARFPARPVRIGDLAVR
ncbi:NAD(P)/FAD-dependent oxidoreductase [Brevundimonas diminuta]|uniref:FAD/NAD(P)-dependent oxidoreductase n=1 Tax=Brevundimonas diminuta TaxID=293 RepID=UPI00320A8760